MTETHASIRAMAAEVVKGQRPHRDGGLNRAVVMSVEGNTCTVMVGGEFEQPGVRWLRDGYYPVVGDLVWLIRSGDSDNFVIGRTTDGSEWRTYAPTWGNGWHAGFGLVEARYQLLGTTCELQFRATMGLGFSTGSGAMQILGPYPAETNLAIGVAHYSSTSTGKRWHGGCRILNSGFPQIQFTHEEALLGVTGTSPFTWVQGDIVQARISYEIQTT